MAKDCHDALSSKNQQLAGGEQRDGFAKGPD